jgi:hypothetical protein
MGVMSTLKHISQLFNGTDHRIIKSHCFLCHRELTPNKKIRGNCCVECDYRAGKVGKGLISEELADAQLEAITQKLEYEEWNIDGEDYVKYPSGRLRKL